MSEKAREYWGRGGAWAKEVGYEVCVGGGGGGGGDLVLSVTSSLLLQVPALVTPGLETANCLVMTSVYSRSSLGIVALLFLCCAVLCYI